MKKDKIIYWIATSIISGMMLFSAYQYLVSQQMYDAFIHLGFPSYFRIELAIFKLIGASVLIFPQFPNRLKEWAYAGFGIVFISAAIAHYSVDGPLAVLAPMIFLALLVASYVFKTGAIGNRKNQ